MARSAFSPGLTLWYKESTYNRCLCRRQLDRQAIHLSDTAWLFKQTGPALYDRIAAGREPAVCPVAGRQGGGHDAPPRHHDRPCTANPSFARRVCRFDSSSILIRCFANVLPDRWLGPRSTPQPWRSTCTGAVETSRRSRAPPSPKAWRAAVPTSSVPAWPRWRVRCS